MRSEVALLGVLSLIFGIVAFVYPQQSTLFGITYATTYPYRNLGTALIVLGFVALIVSAVMKRGETSARPTLQKPQYEVNERSSKYCSSCGQTLRISDAFCPRCGSKS